MLNLGKLFIVRSSNKNLMKNILIITFFLSLSLAQSDKPFSISVLSDISFSSTDSSFNSSGLELVAMSHLRPNVMARAYLHTPLDGSQSTVEEVYLNFMISQIKAYLEACGRSALHSALWSALWVGSRGRCRRRGESLFWRSHRGERASVVSPSLPRTYTGS